MRRELLPVVLVLVVTACSFNMLGGREKCWPESDRRAASVWRGTLQITPGSAWLATPEGDDIPLLPGTLTFRTGHSGVGELVDGDEAVARTGDDVTLFGGAGSDGRLVVCGLEEKR